jgi:RecA/RadA recombinase
MSKESDAAVKKSLKNFEKNFVKTGREVFDEKCQLKSLSISPALDFALNGGLLEGTWVQVVGKAKTGKTSSVLQMAANAQAEGRNVVYLDAEGRIKKYNLAGIKGLDLDKIQLIQSDGNTILTAEMFLNALEAKIKEPDNEGALFIIDSLSSLLPAKELEGYVSGDFRPGLPKLLGNFCKRMGQVVPKTKAIIVGIHHLISTQSSMPNSAQWKADGGVKIGYQYDTMLQVGQSKNWIDGDGNRIGQEIHWKILTSSQGTDKTDAISFFRFNHGLDDVEETVALADDFGLFKKAGAWYSLPFLEKHLSKLGDEAWDVKKYSFQGKAKLCAFLNSNQTVMDIIQEDMKEFLA